MICYSYHTSVRWLAFISGAHPGAKCSFPIRQPRVLLTHSGRVTHICVGKLTNIDSDNGLSLEWRQAIIWTNVGILLIGPLGTNFGENLFEILTFSFTKMGSKVSSAKWWPFFLGLNVLIRVVWQMWLLRTLRTHLWKVLPYFKYTRYFLPFTWSIILGWVNKFLHSDKE